VVTCIQCGNSEAKQYFVISGTSDKVCGSCFNKDDPIQTGPVVKKIHLRIFTRWRCLTHNCGSYSTGNFTHHVWDECEIVYEDTVGIVKPKTFGGFNGDVSRKHFPEWKKYTNKKVNRLQKIKAWKEYSEQEQLRKDTRRKRQPTNFILNRDSHGHRSKRLS